MSETAGGRRQRGVMASDAEWERVGLAAARHGMERSRYLLRCALEQEPLPGGVLRLALREMLTLALLEKRRLREAGAGAAWEDACDAVDDWMRREGVLEHLTDPGAANRWKAVGAEVDGEDAG